MKYPFSEVEAKWQAFWDENKVYKTDLSDTRKKMYTLVMFIYPSGAKLHIGHWYNYGPADTWARHKKLKGYNVFEPMGYDAFGLPAENYAIKTGIHPYDSTMTNIADIRKQLKEMGCMYDWDAELMTCVPEYYKWNQWLFLQMYKKGLAYRKNAPVNWCTSCHTTLANEQVLSDGTCERCGNIVIQKNLTQWFFKITQYAEELLSGLDTIEWPDRTKLMQRNWIGKSEGAEVRFGVEGSDEKISVFTTRPDTLFGVTYVVLAPEHPLVDKLCSEESKPAIEEYREAVKRMTEIERSSTAKEKTGVPIGRLAVNPVNGEKIPIWIADYALMQYGTGCVMAVPGHDERDFEFAKKFSLPIRKVILEQGTDTDAELTTAFVEPGTMIASGHFTGRPSELGKQEIIEWLAEQGFGSRRINYRLRDWLISRQRYWGTPIPVVHCPKCGEVPVPEDRLPIELPYDVEFTPGGESPLAKHPDFIKTVCPVCGCEDAHRDPDTMDTFVDSSWYYLRYLNPKVTGSMFDKDLGNAWAPVDSYIGGAEHATMHLLYARFIHKFLRDSGLVHSDEPFQMLTHQGTITNQGAKMSKSRGNVVNPNVFIDKVGGDVFRLYLMFMGPFEQGGDWSDKGIAGTERFVQRAFDLVSQYKGIAARVQAAETLPMGGMNSDEKEVYGETNRAATKVDADIAAFKFNTAIATLMELQNTYGKHLSQCGEEVIAYVLQRYVVMFAPLAPHLAEECWEMLGNADSLFAKPVWFEPDAAALVKDTVNLAVQVSGKLRGTFEVPLDSDEETVKALALGSEKITKYIEGKTIRKIIFVKNKILNIVAN